MSVSYLPDSDADRVSWLLNFKTKLQGYAATFGLTAAEVTSVQNDYAYYAYEVQLHEFARQLSKAVGEHKRLARSSATQQAMPAFPAMPALGTAPAAVNSGIFNRIAKLVQRLKYHLSYTDAIGRDLGIVASVPVFNPNAMQPDLSIRLNAGRPHLKWKKGDSDFIKLFVDRHDNRGFVLLAQVFRNEYIDIAELPEGVFGATWDYKGRYMIGDDEVGQFSQVISINVMRV